jgi:hypothetical protein
VIYGNAALRPMNDVDLLVHREDLERVEKKMLESGYVPEDCNRLIADDNYHFGYSLPNGGLTVEIHWNFLPANLSFGIDMDGQWRRSRTTFLGGAEVSVLCPEDLLLHQCLHASKHLYDIWLKPFCDIFETIRHYGDAIDWDQVRIRSREAGISNCVYLTLVLARELLGAAVPDTLLVTIKPEDFDERFIAMARGRIFDTDKRSADSVSLPPNAFQIIGTSRFMNKAGQFLKRVCPSRAEMTRMYPAASGSLWIFLYYPVRIRTLLLRYGCLGCQLLLRNEEVLVLTKREKDITPLRKWLISAARATEDHAEPQRFPER